MLDPEPDELCAADRAAIDGLAFMPYRFKVLEGKEKKGIRSIPSRPSRVRLLLPLHARGVAPE